MAFTPGCSQVCSCGKIPQPRLGERLGEVGERYCENGRLTLPGRNRRNHSGSLLTSHRTNWPSETMRSPDFVCHWTGVPQYWGGVVLRWKPTNMSREVLQTAP